MRRPKPATHPLPSSAFVLALALGLASLGLTTLSLTACGAPDAGPDDAEPARVVVTGSSTLAPLVADVARRYEAEHPGVRIDVQTGGSSRGLADVRRGLADLGMVSRSPKEGEDDLTWHPLALDGLAILVHADNPVESLDAAQVVAIYRGEIDAWDGVSGTDSPITVVSKAEGRSTLEVFLAYFGLTSEEIDADVIIGDNQQAIKTVAGNPGAIAYVSIGTAEYEAASGAPIRLLRLGNALPSTEAVRAGTYPVSRTLHLVSKGDVSNGEPNVAVAEFLAYLRSSEVTDLVESHYFVPLADGSADGGAP